MVGLGCERRTKLRHRLVIPLELRERGAKGHTCLDVVRINIERSAEAAYGFLQRVPVCEQFAQPVARLGEIRIGGQSGAIPGNRFVDATELKSATRPARNSLPGERALLQV